MENVGGFNDCTQTDDNEQLAKQLSKHPLLNPAKCTFVPPRKNEENSLKVEPDKALTVNFLERGVNGFSGLPGHLRDAIFSQCEQFHPILVKAYIACIKLYHIQSNKHSWNDNMYNLKLPNLDTYLTDSLFVAESEEVKTRLTRLTSEHIQTFSLSMYKQHEKHLADQAGAAHALMLVSYDTCQSYPLMAAWCDLHDLQSLSDKLNALRILQDSLNYVCKFAFPAACKTCSSLLDSITSKLEFQPGELHQVQFLVPLIGEELLFKRDPPDRPRLPKEHTLPLSEQVLPPTELPTTALTPGATKTVSIYLQYVLVLETNTVSVVIGVQEIPQRSMHFWELQVWSPRGSIYTYSYPYSAYCIFDLFCI